MTERLALSSKGRAVDTLVMTATPIPRTLQMSLAGVRDMSVIETPPLLGIRQTRFVEGELHARDVDVGLAQDLADRFGSSQGHAYVNAVLDRAARQWRADEIAHADSR